MKQKFTWEAGVWDQIAESEGRKMVVWSRHRTRQLAEKAAKRYAREARAHGPRTGGSLSWSGGLRPIGAEEVEWVG